MCTPLGSWCPLLEVICTPLGLPPPCLGNPKSRIRHVFRFNKNTSHSFESPFKISDWTRILHRRRSVMELIFYDIFTKYVFLEKYLPCYRYANSTIKAYV